MTDSPVTPEDKSEWMSHPVVKALASTFNIELLRDAAGEFEDVNWYVVSLTTFHIGVVWLTVWSFLLTTMFITAHLVNSESVFSALSRAVTVVPFFPIALFIFAAFSRRSAKRLTEKSPPKNGWGQRTRAIALFTVSYSAIIIAAVFRWAIFNATPIVVGDSLSHSEIITLMFVDSGYLSLILIGIGGFSTLIYEPNPGN